jgi:hypothetical protein
MEKQLKKNAAACLIIIGLVLILFLSGCASVPKESVELSREISKGIAESQRSYTALLNNYFALKRERLDLFYTDEYLPKLISKIMEAKKSSGLPENLQASEIKDVLKIVMKERDQSTEELEKTRLLIAAKSDGFYQQLTQSNAGITSLLQSLVDLKEATSSAAQSLKTATGGKVDLDAVEAKFNEYLNKTGTASGQFLGLFNEIKKQLDKKGE